MQFKTLSLFAFLAVLFTFTSCAVDATETLPGNWSTSDGGTITFNADGSGITADSDFFEFDCGTLNGVTTTIDLFTWSIEDGGSASDNLRLEFADPINNPGCTGSIEFPIEFKGKNKATVGLVILGIGTEVELTR